MKLLDFFRESSELYSLEGEEFVKGLLKLCAQFLSAQRVSLWTVKEDILFCEYMYLENEDDFIGGLLVRKENCAGFMDYLQKQIVISAEKPFDAEIGACMGEYLVLRDTNSLLMASLTDRGKLTDLIMCEYDTKRAHSEEDICILLLSTVYLREHHERQRALFTANMYNLLSAVNNIVLKANSKEEIFQQLCQIMVQVAGLRMVWIGFLDDESNLKPHYACGSVEGYLDEIKINIYDERLSKGPSARAILEQKVQVNNDTETNPAILPWRVQMLKRKYLSSCAYPIMLKGKVIGTINLYSDKKDFFSQEVIRLVEEVGENVSYALEHLGTLKNEQMLYKAVEQSEEWTLITDVEGKILYTNPAVERISGYTREELIGKTPRVFKSGFHDKEFYKKLWDTILSGEEFHEIFINRRKDESLFYLDQIITPIKDEEGKITNFVSTARDITSMREIEEKMRKIIDYDPLTNLPRRDRFLRELETTIKEKRDSTIVIFLMDIHNFSAVNVLYGYEFGDKVLRFFAERLRTLPGFWARYGDDAFIGFKELDSKGELYNLLKDIFKVGELKLEDFSYRLGFHVGVSICPDDANNAQDLLHAVEIALRNAQKKAPGSFELYNEEEKEELLERLKLAEELRRALEKGEFLVHFQPIYSSLDLKPVMAEALLRWNSERFGFLEASSFINILEETELIVDVGYYVFEQCVSVIKQYNLEIPISINLSPVQIKREDLPDRLFEITMGVPAERILLEITEGVIIEDLQKAYKLLKVLKERGFSIVLDDFGVKYSSLSYLTKLPIDYIKIDMSFTKEVDADEKVLNVVKAIVAIANTLGLKIVVEGIERPSQLDILRKVGCHYLQGFYLGKPMEIRDFLKLLLS